MENTIISFLKIYIRNLLLKLTIMTYWNILKNAALGLFGVAIISMGVMITSYFDKAITEDSYILPYLSITWAAYIYCKAKEEYHKLNQ
jgi:hypothetical protein